MNFSGYYFFPILWLIFQGLTGEISEALEWLLKYTQINLIYHNSIEGDNVLTAQIHFMLNSWSRPKMGKENYIIGKYICFPSLLVSEYMNCSLQVLSYVFLHSLSSENIAQAVKLFSCLNNGFYQWFSKKLYMLKALDI